MKVMKSKIYALENKANTIDDVMKYHDNSKNNNFNNKVFP